MTQGMKKRIVVGLSVAVSPGPKGSSTGSNGWKNLSVACMKTKKNFKGFPMFFTLENFENSLKR
jgi:hypothetical protein